MPPAPVPPEVAAFLAGANPAVVATLRPDGSPPTTATWYEWRPDGTVLLNMDEVRPRLRWMRRDARVALTCFDPGTFYRHVSLLGEVTEVYEDADRADIDRIAMRYTGRPYPRHDHRRWSAVMRGDAWHGWDRDPRVGARPGRPRLPV